MHLYRSLVGKLSRLFGLDMHYVVSGGSFLTFTQVTSAVGSLLLTIAFANLLAPETYGTYKYVLSVYALLAIAAMPGIDTALLQSVSKGFDGVLRPSILLKFRFALLGTLASIIYAGYEFSRGNTELAWIFVLVGMAVPLMEPLTLGTSFLNGKKRFFEWACVEVGTQIISITCLVGTMLLTKNTIFLIIGYFVPYILIRAVTAFFIVERYATNTERDPALYSYGKTMTGFQILTRMISSADQIVLFHMLGPVQVAIFSLATALPNRVQSVLRITGTLAFPKFAHKSGKEIAKSLPPLMALFAAGIFLMSLVYVVLVPFVFTHLFPNYLPSVTYSQAIIFFTLSAITYPFGSYLAAHKKVTEQYVIALTGFLVKVFCLFIFVPIIGIWGAVLGLLATAVVNIAFAFWYLRKSRFETGDTALTDDQSPAVATL